MERCGVTVRHRNPARDSKGDLICCDKFGPKFEYDLGRCRKLVYRHYLVCR
jgi:hypothetical protein